MVVALDGARGWAGIRTSGLVVTMCMCALNTRHDSVRQFHTDIVCACWFCPWRGRCIGWCSRVGWHTNVRLGSHRVHVRCRTKGMDQFVSAIPTSCVLAGVVETAAALGGLACECQAGLSSYACVLLDKQGMIQFVSFTLSLCVLAGLAPDTSIASRRAEGWAGMWLSGWLVTLGMCAS
jgi:hypothetical protein